MGPNVSLAGLRRSGTLSNPGPAVTKKLNGSSPVQCCLILACSTMRDCKPAGLQLLVQGRAGRQADQAEVESRHHPIERCQ